MDLKKKRQLHLHVICLGHEVAQAMCRYLSHTPMSQRITDNFCRVTTQVWKQRRQKRMTWASECENVFPDHKLTTSQSVLNGFQHFSLPRHSRGCIITSFGQTGIFWIHLLFFSVLCLLQSSGFSTALRSEPLHASQNSLKVLSVGGCSFVPCCCLSFL